MACSTPVLAQDAGNTGGNDGDTIVVTATRREATLDKVPLKIDALSQVQMDQRGIRSIEDISRFTPGLQFTNSGGVSGNTSNNIAIRGISSEVGSATTAIYIDDTPIQIRSIGYFGSNPYPRIFDLDRVEVLKGPQGTLFGASAEGGAVRFITPAPDFGKLSVYGRGEVTATRNGGESYEGGVAVGAPIVEDKIAFRASASYRRDGGYIDHIDYVTGDVLDKDVNWERTVALRGALGLRPVEGLTITSSIFFQNQYQPQRSQFWEGYSDYGSADYVSGYTRSEPRRDRFYIPAVKVEYDAGDVMLVSNTSWFVRRSFVELDYTTYLRALRGLDPRVPTTVLRSSGSSVTTKQRNFTQEFRIQSQPGKTLDWVIGGYYSNQRQTQNNFTSSSNPAAPATGFSYLEDVASKDDQLAAFVNLDLHVNDKLTLTAGARISQVKFTFAGQADGPANGGFSSSEGRSSETPFTPKIGISYQLDSDNLFYANVARGFRQGGAQGAVPVDNCAADLATLGITSSPRTYDSDSVWSYDAGSKNTFAGGRVHLDANAYWIKWKNIQQPVNLPSCGLQYIANLGEADSRGVDLVVDFRLSQAVRIGANVGYNNTTFSKTVEGASGLVLAQKGARLGGPRWTGTAWGEVNVPVSGTVDGYFRADATFRSRGSAIDPRVFGYDPDLSGSPSSDTVSARLGVKTQAIDASLFVNNLFNTSDPLSRFHDTVGSPLYYAFGYRPRTIGLTVTYRQ